MRGIPKIIRNYGTVNLGSNVGFSSAPDQVRNKSTQEGFSINILIVGRRGSGSATLINSMFGAPLVAKNRSNTLTTTKNEIIENDISLQTTITTFHDNDITPVVNYIESKNEEYFENEQGIHKSFRDNRIHVCLYMFPSDEPTEQEIKAMQTLSKLCNFLPIIPKADMYLPEELAGRKEYLKKLLLEHGISFFKPQTAQEESDMDDDLVDLINNLPFAVIASESIYESDGDIIRGRKYPWGMINIESGVGNDWKRLQKLLINTNLDELIERTNLEFYSTYRKGIIELENSSETIKKARYTKLKTEMDAILKEKHNSMLESLLQEEERMERFYQERLSMLDNAVLEQNFEQSVRLQ